MQRNKVALVLGGTNPHIELIRQLHQRGFFVVLIDYLRNPPAKKEADIHEQISTMDNEAVLLVAKKYKVDLIISACVDQANITACYVAEQLGLTKPYSYQTAIDITNKGIMKKVMFENEIPTTRYIYLEKGEVIEKFDLNFPVMVKPADNCSASGVKKVNNHEELSVYLKEAKDISRTGRTVIEEYFEGVEVSAYCFIEDHEAKVLSLTERLSVIEGDKNVLKCYGTVTPPNISLLAERKIQDAATRIANAFGLDNTPLHVQALVKDDEIDIIEFAPRIGGGISYETIKKYTGFDIISATIDSYLEKKVHVVFTRGKEYYCIDIIYGSSGVFDHMDGIESLIDDGIIDSFHYHKTKGMELSTERASSSRIGAFLVHGISREDTLNKVSTAMKRLSAISSDGKDILRKDLYVKF